MPKSEETIHLATVHKVQFEAMYKKSLVQATCKERAETRFDYSNLHAPHSGALPVRRSRQLDCMHVFLLLWQRKSEN